MRKAIYKNNIVEVLKSTTGRDSCEVSAIMICSSRDLMWVATKDLFEYTVEEDICRDMCLAADIEFNPQYIAFARSIVNGDVPNVKYIRDSNKTLHALDTHKG